MANAASMLLLPVILIAAAPAGASANRVRSVLPGASDLWAFGSSLPDVPYQPTGFSAATVKTLVAALVVATLCMTWALYKSKSNMRWLSNRYDQLVYDMARLSDAAKRQESELDLLRRSLAAVQDDRDRALEEAGALIVQLHTCEEENRELRSNLNTVGFSLQNMLNVASVPDEFALPDICDEYLAPPLTCIHKSMSNALAVQ